MLKEVRPVVVQRHLDSLKNRQVNKPLFISCLSATGLPKLKIMLNEDSVWLRTNVNVQMVREELFRSREEGQAKMMKNNTG